MEQRVLSGSNGSAGDGGSVVYYEPIRLHAGFSKSQVLEDLRRLLRRHAVPFGSGPMLESFGTILATRADLRESLFALCEAISLAGQHGLTDDQLLVLLAQAAGGAEAWDAEGSTRVPDGVRVAFRSGFAAWRAR